MLVQGLDVLHNQVVLCDAAQVLRREHEVPLRQQVHGYGQELLTAGFDLALGVGPGPQVGQLHLQVENDYAVLPPVQPKTFGRGVVVEGDDDIVAEGGPGVGEGGGEVVALLVRDGEVRLLDSVLGEQLELTKTNV